MIQFNLLPDVKKEYVKAKRTKRLITTISVLSSVIALVVVGIMFSVVNIAQKNHIDSLTDDINAATTEIQSTQNLNTILTVQNQLSLLPDLHLAKPETSRIFDYVTFVAPETVKVTTLNLNVPNTSMSIAGSADSIATLNKFVSNIRTVSYAVQGSEPATEGNETPAFSSIITSLGADNENATFEINLIFDPVIFDNTNEVVMTLSGQSFSTATGIN